MMIFSKNVYLRRNFPEIWERKSRGLSPDSTSLPDVNLVDGLPSARHTEAVWGAHGVFGPAPICNLHKKMYEIEQNCYRKLHVRFVQVKVCI